MTNLHIVSVNKIVGGQDLLVKYLNKKEDPTVKTIGPL